EDADASFAEYFRLVSSLGLTKSKFVRGGSRQSTEFCLRKSCRDSPRGWIACTGIAAEHLRNFFLWHRATKLRHKPKTTTHYPQTLATCLKIILRRSLRMTSKKRRAKMPDCRPSWA